MLEVIAKIAVFLLVIALGYALYVIYFVDDYGVILDQSGVFEEATTPFNESSYNPNDPDDMNFNSKM